MKKIFILILVFFCLSTTFYAQELHIYGGEDHNIYLGCLNCDDYDSNSIWNEYGDYGNDYSSESIWNEYSDYGNEYSDYCPWNEYALYPPVVVDKKGNFYGYLTINKYNSKQADFKLALTMYKYYDLIREDVSRWYKKLFE